MHKIVCERYCIVISLEGGGGGGENTPTLAYHFISVIDEMCEIDSTFSTKFFKLRPAVFDFHDMVGVPQNRGGNHPYRVQEAGMEVLPAGPG